MKEKAIVFLITLLAFGFFPVKIARAQISLGTALPIEMSEGGVQDGDIISTREAGGYIRSTLANQPFMFGVVTLNPAFYLYDKLGKNQVPVITSGEVYVRVSTEKGIIKRGDAITSSATPGVGVKSTENGYILGIAMEGYEASNTKQIGKILVNANPRFQQVNNNLLSSLLTLPRLSFVTTPANALRYLIAASIGIISFFIGFRYFGRASLEGIKAIGRNPLAKKAIFFIVAINALLTLAVMLVGFGIAYAVLVL